MEKEKYIWEKDGFNREPYQVPEGYFAGFEARLMERLDTRPEATPKTANTLVRPWMAWVTGIAAMLVMGWFGVRTYYWKPLQEVRFQEDIALFVDYCGGDLHEGQLAGYMVDNKLEMGNQVSTEVNELILADPDLAEEFIFETVGF